MLSDAFPYDKIDELYYRYVPVEEAMTPSDWKAEYKKGIPHWAEDMEPSVFAKDFAKIMKVSGVDTVLEVGCGNGRDSIYFAEEGFAVTSIDIVPKAIEMARGNADKVGQTITFKVASVEKLPFVDDKFGAVFTLSVLHSTKLNKSLPEVYRVVKTGGVVFIYIYGDTQYADGRETDDTVNWNDYLSDLKALGFKIRNSYTGNEKEYDDFGEKHRVFVVLLEKL